jgi:hypothetical protein
MARRFQQTNDQLLEQWARGFESLRPDHSHSINKIHTRLGVIAPQPVQPQAKDQTRLVKVTPKPSFDWRMSGQ